MATYYLVKFRRKLHENEEYWTEGGGEGVGGGASKILLDYADPLLVMTEYGQI